MTTLVLLVLGLLTGACCWRRESRWFRAVTALGCVGYMAHVVLMGISHAARFGMIDDVSLLASTARYGTAYKAGLLAAQAVVDSYKVAILAVSVYLGVLALIPVGRRSTK